VRAAVAVAPNRLLSGHNGFTRPGCRPRCVAATTIGWRAAARPGSSLGNVIERRRVSSGAPLESVVGYCRAIRVGDRVVVGGTAPIWPDGHVDPDVAVQARRCLDIIGTALDQLGASFDDVVRTRLYLVDAADIDAVGRVHGEVFGAIRPVCTGVVVAALLDPAWRIEIEAEAILWSRESLDGQPSTST
jgi:enamine deaminase RidA (YjgF/YER057c/UK114 family)